MSNERVVVALDNLRVHQRQLDADGVMVGVSREALNEVILAFGREQQRRASVVTPEMVERATRAEYVKHNEGDDYDLEPESAKRSWLDRNRFILTAALSVSHETGDGENEPVAMMLGPWDMEGDCISWNEGCEKLEAGDYLYRHPLAPTDETQGAKRDDNWEALRVLVAKAIHAADYGPHVDLELEWDANEDGRMKQADAALMAVGIRSLISDLADMGAYIRQRDDAISDLEIAEASLAAMREALTPSGDTKVAYPAPKLVEVIGAAITQLSSATAELEQSSPKAFHGRVAEALFLLRTALAALSQQTRSDNDQ